jgi:hypothetical protein
MLAAGESLRVGRTAKSEIVVADDPTMSGVHYEVQCRDDGCRVRDLGSRNGLFVNGRQVAEAEVRDGDQVRAGRTFFGVAIELARPLADDETTWHEAASDETLPETPRELPRQPKIEPAAGSPLRSATVLFPAGEPPEPPESQEPAGATLRYFPTVNHLSAVWPPGPERLFAVVDGAAALGLVDQAKSLGLRTESLIVGLRSPYLAAVAPYLIEVTSASGFLDLWHGYLSKNPGVLLTSTAEFGELLEHARRLFVTRNAAGKDSFFRFYDPKVLKAWLATAPVSELKVFFRCITSIVAGLDDPAHLSRLSLTDERVEALEIGAGLLQNTPPWS